MIRESTTERVTLLMPLHIREWKIIGYSIHVSTAGKNSSVIQAKAGEFLTADGQFVGTVFHL